MTTIINALEALENNISSQPTSASALYSNEAYEYSYRNTPGLSANEWPPGL